MNPSNYCTLEMARRLVDAGIMLETERYWRKGRNEKTFSLVDYHHKDSDAEYYSAVSMAEAWRELPEDCFIQRGEDEDISGTGQGGFVFFNANPTDALCKLLLLLKGREE